MERAFAETLNLRLRIPRLVMGEVYLLAVVDYDDVAMKEDRVAWKGSSVPVAKFINTFLGITERDDQDDLDATLYKYERSALVLADFRSDPPKIYETLDELKSDGHVARDFDADYSKLTPASFTKGLVDAYLARHQ